MKLHLSFLLFLAVTLTNALQSETLFRRPESLQAVPGQTQADIKNHDADIVRRLIQSYQVISSENHQRGDSMWGMFFSEKHEALDKKFKKGKERKVAAILRNPGASELFYGFDALSKSVLLNYFSNPHSQQTHATSCLDSLVRFAEAIGAIPLDNPEAYIFIAPIPWRAEDVISLINQKLGVSITFPNPYPFENGLLTPLGVMSYRVPQALYQAFTIKELLKNVTNPRVLEIGAGLGRTAYYARLLGIKDYTIVDLPFTTMSSGYFLGVTLGENQVLFSGEMALDPQNRVKLITPLQFLESHEQYDLIINADGFTEYDPQLARAYLARIRESSPIFLSINHESNSYTVEELLREDNPPAEVFRFPYWMRQGYAEEIIRFK